MVFIPETANGPKKESEQVALNVKKHRALAGWFSLVLERVTVEKFGTSRNVLVVTRVVKSHVAKTCNVRRQI